MTIERGIYSKWQEDWCIFARDVLGANMDEEQKAILRSVQHNPRTAVASGTARGKDFISAVAAICFLYLTPRWDAKGNLIANTKVALTAPTDRQVKNIMMPEVARLFNRAKSNGVTLPGRLNAYDIRTESPEWFLTGFKADEHNHEAWSGFHAVNTMFVVTEASGLGDSVFNALEGNLQQNARLLIVFNPNNTSGYAARAMASERFARFRLSSLNATNVVERRNVINGQVDYPWVCDKVKSWCTPITEDTAVESDGDFKWEGQWYRPNDLFRVKVLGLFPRVTEDSLIPYDWITEANRRYMELQSNGRIPTEREGAIIGADVAGMGRDSSVLCIRVGDTVTNFECHHSNGEANHMHVVGMIQQHLANRKSKACIDTIGEGAGVYSRLIELGLNNAYSCKFSEAAGEYKDVTGQYKFANMRAYCYWALRDWLDPKNGHAAALPTDEQLAEELTATRWRFQSNGTIIIEPKESIKAELRRSPDKADALANTFYPKTVSGGRTLSQHEIADIFGL